MCVLTPRISIPNTSSPTNALHEHFTNSDITKRLTLEHLFEIFCMLCPPLTVLGMMQNMTGDSVLWREYHA